jgi:general secretion pathway protein G
MKNGNNGKIKRLKQLGFTLVELLVVLSILALLLTIASPKYFASIERAKEATLKQSLMTMRDGIDKYYADNGKYPESIEALVEAKYINKLPEDPITELKTTWQIVAPEPPLEGEVYDVHSGAEGVAMDGTKYSEW